MAIVVTGAEGYLQWGYRPAATLRAWTMTRTDAGGWVVSGTLAQTDDFAVSQRPLKFVTPNGVAFPIMTLQIEGASASVVLGPKEPGYGYSH